MLGKPLVKGSLLASFHCDFFGLPKISKRKELRDHRFTVMASNHTDAEYVVSVARYYGVQVSRGDSLHEGFKALRMSLNSIKQGFSLVMTVDGPVGPRFKIKLGIVVLAKQTKKPIQAIFCMAKNAYVFKKSWDHFVVPYPFSQLYCYIGECFHCDQNISREENLKQFKIYIDRQFEVFSSLLPEKLKKKSYLAEQ